MDTGLKVLLLDDHSLVRTGMKLQILMAEPLAQIVEASNYEDAIDLLAQQEIDIAFLDIDLRKEMGGLDVLKHIRDTDLETRAIMLSGQDDRETVMHCIEMGAAGYIVKNMDADGLFRRAIDTVFSGGVFLPASVIGRGGFTPSPTVEATSVTPEELGIHGRLLETLYYVSLGMPNKSIARSMSIEEGTIRKDYMPRLFRAFRVARRTEILVELSRRGIKVPPPAAISNTKPANLTKQASG